MVPRFIQKPRSTEVIEGDSLTIVCEVVGDPKPELVWLRDWLNVSETSSQFPFAPPLCVSLRDFTDNNGRPRDRSRSLGECDLSDAAVFSFFLSFSPLTNRTGNPKSLHLLVHGGAVEQ